MSSLHMGDDEPATCRVRSYRKEAGVAVKLLMASAKHHVKGKIDVIDELVELVGVRASPLSKEKQYGMH